MDHAPYRQTAAAPQAAPYRPAPEILPLAPWLADTVAAADFPQTLLRWRNDRAAATVGLAGLTDEAWIAHFGRFAPLPDNLPQPLALRYHGHQFRVYNPDIGDGRGFLFAQMRDAAPDGGPGRLLDLGTKGSGRTPWSRGGDGRLTLKGAMREILATEMLAALGVNTSRTFSVIETGEALVRGDEPSPTRAAVLVRLSHGHIRIGSFQRLAALEEADHLAALVDYCLAQFPGPPPPADAPGREEPAAMLLHQVVVRLADMAAGYVAAGFVHGVLNSDNMNITGESFDYGPWRWLPRWDGGFTAAYFDHQGLYAFARQAEAIHWNCAQLAIALRTLIPAPPLIAALDRFEGLYLDRLRARVLWRLGRAGNGPEADAALVAAAGAAMRARDEAPDAFFARHRWAPDDSDFAAQLATHAPLAIAPAPASIPTNHIDEVERIWTAIDRDDDWQPLHDHVTAIRALGAALGPAPVPMGHAAESEV